VEERLRSLQFVSGKPTNFDLLVDAIGRLHAMCEPMGRKTRRVGVREGEWNGRGIEIRVRAGRRARKTATSMSNAA
jgi:hypothetical protein